MRRVRSRSVMARFLSSDQTPPLPPLPPQPSPPSVGASDDMSVGEDTTTDEDEDRVSDGGTEHGSGAGSVGAGGAGGGGGAAAHGGWASSGGDDVSTTGRHSVHHPASLSTSSSSSGRRGTGTSSHSSGGAGELAGRRGSDSGDQLLPGTAGGTPRLSKRHLTGVPHGRVHGLAEQGVHAAAASLPLRAYRIPRRRDRRRSRSIEAYPSMSSVSSHVTVPSSAPPRALANGTRLSIAIREANDEGSAGVDGGQGAGAAVERGGAGGVEPGNGNPVAPHLQRAMSSTRSSGSTPSMSDAESAATPTSFPTQSRRRGLSLAVQRSLLILPPASLVRAVGRVLSKRLIATTTLPITALFATALLCNLKRPVAVPLPHLVGRVAQLHAVAVAAGAVLPCDNAGLLPAGVNDPTPAAQLSGPAFEAYQRLSAFTTPLHSSSTNATGARAKKVHSATPPPPCPDGADSGTFDARWVVARCLALLSHLVSVERCAVPLLLCGGTCHPMSPCVWEPAGASSPAARACPPSCSSTVPPSRVPTNGSEVDFVVSCKSADPLTVVELRYYAAQATRFLAPEAVRAAVRSVDGLWQRRNQAHAPPLPQHDDNTPPVAAYTGSALTHPPPLVAVPGDRLDNGGDDDDDGNPRACDEPRVVPASFVPATGSLTSGSGSGSATGTDHAMSLSSSTVASVSGASSSLSERAAVGRTRASGPLAITVPSGWMGPATLPPSARVLGRFLQAEVPAREQYSSSPTPSPSEDDDDNDGFDLGRYNTCSRRSPSPVSLPSNVLLSVVAPFLDAAWLVAVSLQMILPPHKSGMEVRRFMARCQTVGRELFYQVCAHVWCEDRTAVVVASHAPPCRVVLSMRKP